MANYCILVVDDEPEIRDIISRYLTREFFEVITTGSSIEAIEIIEKSNPNLIILDIILPDLDGISLCQKIRSKTSSPILFLSCKDEEIDKVLGLEVGGDDYITKPFSPRELVARVKSHLRRNERLNINNDYNPIISFDKFEIDSNSYTVKIDKNPIDLPPKEFEILSLMARNPNRIFSPEQLYSLIWIESSVGDTRTVAVHVSNLRKKIESDPAQPKYIVTVRGVGYKLVL